MNKSKMLGGIFLVAGTAIGAGMLSLPLVSAGAGYFYSTVLMVLVWALSFGMALLLEVNSAFADTASFGTLAYATLGRPGQIVTAAAFLLLLYALTAAYMTGGASLMGTGLSENFGIHLPDSVRILLFSAVLGGFVLWSTKAVDYANRLLFSGKLIFFILVVSMLMPHIDVVNLYSKPGTQYYLLAAIPIFFTSFGFHNVLPSVRQYLGGDIKLLLRVVFVGSLLPLLVYLLWQAVSFGILSPAGTSSLQSVAAHNGEVGDFISLLGQAINSKIVHLGINLFSDVAVTTSFLGVTLSLRDFFADLVKDEQPRRKAIVVALLTFVPPLGFALFYPHGFILALGYAGMAFAVFGLFMPVLMVRKLRSNPQLVSTYRAPGGVLLPWLIFAIGVAIIGLQIASNFHQLPVV